MSVATGTAATSVSPAQAHRRCARITRSAAANFYYGIALLPPSKRRAMCAIYAFARRVDDLGDGELPRERKLALLEEQRAGLAQITPSLEQDPARPARPAAGPASPGPAEESARPGPAGPVRPEPARPGPARPAGARDEVIVALADSHRRFGLPLDALEDLIDGVRMDVEERGYQTFEELVLYCRKVAGSIGRLSLAVFGSHDMRSASSLADDLGVAMQLTNILRDLREDAQRGRVYLPSEDLTRYHLRDSAPIGAAEIVELAKQGARAESSAVEGFSGDDVGQLFALMRFQALRAHDWFHRGMALVPLLDRRSAACVMAMTGIYRRLLWRIQDRPDLALSGRISLPARSKAVVAISSVLRPRNVPERHPAERVL